MSYVRKYAFGSRIARLTPSWPLSVSAPFASLVAITGRSLRAEYAHRSFPWRTIFQEVSVSSPHNRTHACLFFVERARLTTMVGIVRARGHRYSPPCFSSSKSWREPLTLFSPWRDRGGTGLLLGWCCRVGARS